MSKRLTRINNPEELLKLEKLPGIEINAVLQNGSTYFGRIDSIDSQFMVMKDTRGHTHKIALSNLYEIVIDRESNNTFILP
jgi:hypothetical protein